MEVSALDILKYPVVCDLAKHVKPMVTLNNVIERKKDKYINLSPQQMNLWHFQKLYPYDSSYNTVIVYSTTGPLNVNKLISSMQVIIDKHDALRTKIKIIDGEPMQYFDPMFLRIEPEELDMNTIKLTIKSDICEPFNMLNKRLCKFKLFKNMSKQDCYILSIIKHNIITDAYSENIIKMDLQNMYNNSYVSSKDNTYEVYINSLDGKMNDTYWHNKFK